MLNNKNIDSKINTLGYEIVEKIKIIDDNKERKKLFNHIDKALGVLANDGVYAYYVFCESKKVTNIFVTDVIAMLGEYFGFREDQRDETFFENLSEDLYQLLFFKEVLEKALIYARYHAKAWGEDIYE